MQDRTYAQSPRCIRPHVEVLIAGLTLLKRQSDSGLGGNVRLFYHLDQAVRLLLLENRIIPFCSDCVLALQILREVMRSMRVTGPPL
jgi:hypothetical protein